MLDEQDMCGDFGGIFEQNLIGRLGYSPANPTLQ